jgi:hypothetical protein
MTQSDAAQKAEEFLDKYVTRRRFSPPDVVQALRADPDDEEAKAQVVLSFYRVVPLDGGTNLRFYFDTGMEVGEKDPRVQPAIDDSMSALKAAMPDLQSFKLEIELSRGRR